MNTRITIVMSTYVGMYDYKIEYQITHNVILRKYETNLCLMFWWNSVVSRIWISGKGDGVG